MPFGSISLFMYHLPCSLVCDYRVSSALFSTASRHINKSYSYRSGISVRRDWDEILPTQHRHQIVLLCVSSPSSVSAPSLVRLVANIIGAIHLNQQRIEHRQWETVYASLKDPAMAWLRLGALQCHRLHLDHTCQMRPPLVNTVYQLPHQLSTCPPLPL